MWRAPERLPTPSISTAGLPRALDPRAHLDEAIGEIDDLRFARRVDKQRMALGERSSHERGMRAADRHLGKMDLGAGQPLRRLGMNIAGLDLDLAPSFSRTMMRRSTGLVPIAQPPGRETLASPIRASSGAMTQKLARILETNS